MTAGNFYTALLRTLPVRLFWALVTIFLLHRLFSFTFLSGGDDFSWLQTVDYFFVGMLSDLWVAFLFTVLGIILAQTLRILRVKPLVTVVAYFFLVALLIILHQSYVEFFNIQVLPFHFRYLLDPQFMTSGSFVYSAMVVFLAAASGVLMWLLWRGRGVRTPWRTGLWLLLGVTPILLGLHALNIHWRVKHFVPAQLHLNVFEHLFLQFAKTSVLTPLNVQEVAELRSMVGKSQPMTDLNEQLKDLVLWNTGIGIYDPFAQSLRSDVIARINAGRKPTVMVVLLESARPIDFSVYADADHSKGFALTPHFDRLARDGILFRNAYSTGTVTRSGQEAVWCGILSSMYQSLMRERADLRWPCLPARLKGRAESFWLHGGVGAFDGQRAFWKRQDVSYLMSREDFPVEAASSGWGVGDRTMFERASQETARLRAESSKDFLLGQILTVSNHIPWRVPQDYTFPEDVEAQLAKAHRSAKTNAYVDLALGEMVENIKRNGLWEDAIVIFVSDHGSKVPGYYANLYPQDDLRRAKLMSHVVLLVSGGMVESLRRRQTTPPERHEWVSQAGIAPFISHLVGQDDVYFAESLFLQNPKSPVFVQLEDSYFLPELGLEVGRDEIGRSFDNIRDHKQRFALRYMQAYLQYLRLPNLDRS